MNAAPDQDPDRREAHQGARRRRRPERRPAGGARGHREAHPGARRRRHGVRHHRTRRRHRHRRRAGHRQPRERARRADHRRRHQAVHVRGPQARDCRPSGASRSCATASTASSRFRTSGCSATIDRTTPLLDAFATADDVLRQAIQGISDLILVPGLINLDFADVKTIMTGMGVAVMGTGIGEGETRAVDAAEARDLEPAARGRVDRRRARRDHQRHRRLRTCRWSKSARRRRSSTRRRTRTPTSSSAPSSTRGSRAG